MDMKLTVKAARINFTKLTQKEVADHLGLSLTAYCRKENGKSRFYADELDKLAKLFGVSIDIFFGNACPKKTQSEKSEAI